MTVNKTILLLFILRGSEVWTPAASEEYRLQIF
jgi:hypothetical protein